MREEGNRNTQDVSKLHLYGHELTYTPAGKWMKNYCGNLGVN